VVESTATNQLRYAVVGAAQLDHGFFGLPAGQDGVDAAGCPGQLVLHPAAPQQNSWSERKYGLRESG
jgi:hypothetical protein